MKEQIKNVMKRAFELEDISDDVSMENCDKWDSLNHLNLIMELEEEFNVSLEPEDIAVMRSVDEIEVVLNRMLKV